MELLQEQSMLQYARSIFPLLYVIIVGALLFLMKEDTKYQIFFCFCWTFAAEIIYYGFLGR
jgi:hypothetical protein